MAASRSAAVAVLVVGLWLAIQVVFHDTVIFHDGWKHGFPMFLSVARHTTCGGLPRWITGVDSGSPLLIQVVSTSLTQLVKLPAEWLTGCLDLGFTSAFYVYKAQLIFGYLVFAAGMYVLARALFASPLPALYLFTATLYAGLFLDVVHSSQVLAIGFWMPWTVLAAIRVHRARDGAAAARALTMLALFVSLQALDQYPHFVALILAVGGGLYAWLWPERVKTLARTPFLRLWPVALIAVATGFQLWLLRATIGDYQPSLRAHLVVNPRQFDETGFVQLTALIGAFLPVGFLAEFDALGNVLLARIPHHWWLRPLLVFPGVSRAFIFRLDLLLFYLGFVPAVLGTAFALRRGAGRRRVWWLAFAGVLFLISLQHSGLYLLILRLPFFNVFRSYFLVVILVVFAWLVIGAYGMNAYLTEAPDARRRLLQKSLAVILIASAIAALSIAWLLTGVPPAVASRTASYLVLDGLLVAAGAAVVASAAAARRPEAGAHAMIFTVAASGAVFFAVVIGMVGVSRADVFARYELDGADRTPAVASAGWRDAATFTRKECHLYAQCYASRRDTVSLRRDLEGTFLRNRNEAIFQDGLAPPVVKALSGLTRPVVWVSRSVATHTTRAELIDHLNRHADEIDQHLADTVYVSPDAAGRLGASSNGAVPGRTQTAPEGGLIAPRRDQAVTAVKSTQDAVSVRYRAAAPAFLNAAISYDPSWRATVNGVAAPVTRGNFNGLVVPLPAGTGEVVLRYRSAAADAFFYIRYVALVAAVAVMTWLAVDVWRRPPAAVPSAAA